MWCAQRCRPPSSSTLLHTMKMSRASATGASGEEAFDDGLGGGASVVLTERLDEPAPPIGVVTVDAVKIGEGGEKAVLLTDHRPGRVLGEVEVRAPPEDVFVEVGSVEDHRAVTERVVE